jgi:hypothetical protein
MIGICSGLTTCSLCLERQRSVQDDAQVFALGLPWDGTSKELPTGRVVPSSRGQSVGEHDRVSLRSVHVYPAECEPLLQGVNCVTISALECLTRTFA